MYESTSDYEEVEALERLRDTGCGHSRWCCNPPCDTYEAWLKAP